MKIGGLMKLTLLDFPGYVACTVFLEGCNFRCPFCHIADLAEAKSPDRMTEEEFFGFLKKRQGILDAVCVSGGEPLMTEDVLDFLKKIKDMGYKIKLDTNGSFPERLKAAVQSGLCDYVAMDIKNAPFKYGQTSGNEKITFDTVKESIGFLKKSGISHEFRTTVVKDFHTKDDIAEIAKIIGADEKYFIQPFRDGETVMQTGLMEFENDELKALLDAAKELVPAVCVRGIDL